MLGNSGSAINNEVARPPGISIAVAVDGKIVWAEGFGFADIEQCVAVTPKTKFRIGSTSKPLTAAGAALLYDQGRIDFDAPIQQYFIFFTATTPHLGAWNPRYRNTRKIFRA